MKTCFAFIFWGLILCFFDFNFTINGTTLRLLPDILGYFLVAIGTGGLAGVSGQFITSCSIAYLLMVASVATYFLSGSAAESFGYLITLGDCAMIWTLLGGIIEVTNGRERPDLAQRAANRRSVYVAVVAAMTALGMMVSSANALASFLNVALLVAWVVACVMILHLVYRVMRTFS